MRTPLIAAVCLCVLTACTVRSEDVRFPGTGATLAGTLFLPRGAAPFPAIVLVHGDGRETRDGYRFLARQFAANGVAALIYDKRGAGESTGRWPASFDQLAGDAVAAIGFLRTRPEIDGDRIGIWGGSQGGWIAPLAATSPAARVQYIVVKAGPAVGPAEVARWKSVSRVAQAGYSPQVQAEVSRLMDVQFRILRTGNGWDDLDARVRRVRSEPWFPLVAVMRHSQWRSSWMTYGTDIDFDPAATLSRLDVPILWILGASDPETPHRQTLATLNRLKREGKDITVTVFPGADHQLELPRILENRPRYAPGYPDGMVEWVVDRSGKGKGPS